MQSQWKISHVPEIVLRWLEDSGASQHVLPKSYISKNRRKFADHLQPFTHGYAFERANGFVTPESCVTAWIQHLREKTEFVVMKDSPAILSLGRLVREHDYEFHWKPL